MIVYYKQKDRTERIEQALPDMLQLIASNLRAGMTPYHAMKLASRDEFGPLKEEMDYATTKALGIENFAEEMFVSHMQLHRKIKALTGLSSSRFIRTIRINHAAKLFKQGEGYVTEVAFAVGFNNLSFFAKCFIEQYGKSPSDYLKSF